LVEKLGSSDYNISIENHMYGVLPEFHDKWPVLKDFYTILTTTKDRNGTEYISTIEAKNYPFFGEQRLLGSGAAQGQRRCWCGAIPRLLLI
jgi:gamma-glutamyl hydrolase